MFSGFARNELIARSQHIVSLYVVIALLVMLIGFMAYRLSTQVDRLTIYYPPDLANGYTQTVGEVPDPVIYMFASSVWRGVNFWPNDGGKEAVETLDLHRYYLGDSFYSGVRKMTESRIAKGVEIKGRRRSMIELPGHGYREGVSVKPMGASWVVYLNVKLQETASGTGDHIKEEQIRYSLIIQRGSAHPDYNPWGLMITGYESDPTQIVTQSFQE